MYKMKNTVIFTHKEYVNIFMTKILKINIIMHVHIYFFALLSLSIVIDVKKFNRM